MKEGVGRRSPVLRPALALAERGQEMVGQRIVEVVADPDLAAHPTKLSSSRFLGVALRFGHRLARWSLLSLVITLHDSATSRRSSLPCSRATVEFILHHIAARIETAS